MTNTFILLTGVLLLPLIKAVRARELKGCVADKVLKSGEDRAITILDEFETSIWFWPEKDFKDFTLEAGSELNQIFNFSGKECSLQNSAAWQDLQIIKLNEKKFTRFIIKLEGQSCEKSGNFKINETFTLVGHGASYWRYNPPRDSKEPPCNTASTDETPVPRITLELTSRRKNSIYRRSPPFHSASMTTAPVTTAPVKTATVTTAPSTAEPTAEEPKAEKPTDKELMEKNPIEREPATEEPTSPASEKVKQVRYLILPVVVLVVVMVVAGILLLQARRNAVRMMRQQVQQRAVRPEEEVSLTAFEKRASNTTLCLQLSASPRNQYKKHHQHDALLP